MISLKSITGPLSRIPSEIRDNYNNNLFFLQFFGHLCVACFIDSSLGIVYIFPSNQEIRDIVYEATLR